MGLSFLTNEEQCESTTPYSLGVAEQLSDVALARSAVAVNPCHVVFLLVEVFEMLMHEP